MSDYATFNLSDNDDEFSNGQKFRNEVDELFSLIRPIIANKNPTASVAARAITQLLADVVFDVSETENEVMARGWKSIEYFQGVINNFIECFPKDDGQ